MAASAVQAASSNEPMATSVNGEPKGSNLNGVGGVDIIDVRQVAVEVNLKEEILSMFHPKQGLRHLPTLLLYNERGLQIFEEITYLDEYYLTNDEIAVLETYAADIADQISDGSMVIELGSGNLRKVNLLLRALEKARKNVEYYALDLSRHELERTLAQLPKYEHVSCHGLLGTYDDGRAWLKQPANLERQKCILSLGSSIGNFNRDEAAGFLRNFSDVLAPKDSMLIGLDACRDPAKVFHAYNDREGITHRFVLNGLNHANEILGEKAFDTDVWKVIGEYCYDEEGGRHQAFFAPIRDIEVLGEHIRAGERIQVEQSLKYFPNEAQKLWTQAAMVEAKHWKHNDEYGVHLLVKPKMPFSLIPSQYAKSALPSLADWESLWATWDLVTLEMLPDRLIMEKPIKLRNACIFYLGHIPTFLDIQLSKATKGPPTDPAYFWTIFERGIDPDVDNPEHCHDHSEIPDEWPPLDEILTYQEKVRARLRELYGAGDGDIARPVGHAVWMSFEHEVMHLETLLYMLLQSDKTLPPRVAPRPDFESLARKAHSARVENQWFDVPAQEIDVGIDDADGGVDVTANYGWDNEKPARKAQVHAFQAQGRPITNEEYAQYLYDTRTSTIPASWAEVGKVNGHSHANGNTKDGVNGHTSSHTNGTTAGVPASFLEGKAVRTVYGLVPLKLALDWPIFASYNELAGCALWMGGRIPTAEEARSIYTWADMLKKEQAEHKLGKTVPAVNGHLSNDGVEETPPSRGTKAIGKESLPSTLPKTGGNDLFIDLDGANVGFHHWHPVPVTANGNRLAGQAEMGGVWEWTSSVLTKHEGFEAMPTYPGYTADFFDEKHNIVLGGSWATHPRIAGRKSFVNWYQRNYAYPWVGARLVRDI